jgi:uncharacterized protein with HEPN domain
MSPEAWLFRIRHITEAIDRIQQYTAGLDQAGLERDQKTVDAVVWNFQVIGEAARQVPREVQQSHPEVPWSSVIGMRNVSVHAYDRVDVETVWKTVTEDLPTLKEALAQVLVRQGVSKAEGGEAGA